MSFSCPHDKSKTWLYYYSFVFKHLQGPLFASDLSINKSVRNHFLHHFACNICLDLKHNGTFCFWMCGIGTSILYTWFGCFKTSLPFTNLSSSQDFAHYKSGVYKHITGYELGGHAVKLIGWGTTDDGEDYWVCWHVPAWHFSPLDILYEIQNFILIGHFSLFQLLANQWNREWGDVCFLNYSSTWMSVT